MASEVAAHLVAHQLEEAIKLGASASDSETCVHALEAAIKQIKGTYGLAVLFRDVPGLLVATRLGSPLVLGLGQGESFLASDASALVGYCDRVVYLDDRQLCVLTPDTWQILPPDRS